MESEQPRPDLGRPLRILHVEDDEGYAALVKKWLEIDFKHPYELVQCSDMYDAENQIRKGIPFDVAISDARLGPPGQKAAKEQTAPHGPVELLVHLQAEHGTHPVLLTGLEPESHPLIREAGLSIILKASSARSEVHAELQHVIHMISRKREEKPIDRDALAVLGPLVHTRGRGRPELVELVRNRPTKKQLLEWYAGKRMTYTLEERTRQLREVMRKGNLSQTDANRLEKWVRELESLARRQRSEGTTNPPGRRRAY